MSVRNDLESILCDTKWTQLFEERLKRSYNYHNLVFWIALRDLRVRLEVRLAFVTHSPQQLWLGSLFGFCVAATTSKRGGSLVGLRDAG
jgi:hypothetical protein